MKLDTFVRRSAMLVALLVIAMISACSKSNNNPAAPGVAKELNSGDIAPGTTFPHVFASAGSFPYHCTRHPVMTGTVTVAVGSPMAAAVSIVSSSAGAFSPATATVAPGGTVTWTNNDGGTHTVTSN